MLKALLSDLGITFHKTRELGALMDSGTFGRTVAGRV